MKQLWKITTNEYGGDGQTALRLGNIYQIANGYMGYRGTLDEYGPDQKVGITLAGIFDRVGKAWREPVNAPNPGYTSVSLDGVKLSALGDLVESHRQTLSFENASFERETIYASQGKELRFTSTRILSADTPNLGVIRFTVQCDSAAEISVKTGIDGNIWDLNGPHLPKLSSGLCGDFLHTSGSTHECGKQVAVAEALSTSLVDQTHELCGQQNLRVFQFTAEPEKVYVFDKFFAVVTENDPLELPALDAALGMVENAREHGYEFCIVKHDEVWRKRWYKSDVVIEGDDNAQLSLRYSILQLLMVAPLKGSANSIPARALSGQVYKGAVFWDTEMFMYPFFLHTNPEIAGELLRYRIRTLDGARRKALTEGAGYRGAFYAWESQESGDDACTYFNVGDPITGRELRTHFRDKQVHISGDIVIAMWSYFLCTDDDTLLLEGGAEVILECARFYNSYVYFKKDKNRYEVLDVIGPDEYHERVNNNAFTSRVVKETFSIALAVVAHLKKHHPIALGELLEKINIEDELSAFKEVEELLYVPGPDPDTGLIEQFDGYFKLRDASIEELKKNRVHPNEYFGAGQGLAVPTQVIKQADVVMMLNLFKDRYDRATMKANWDYYEPRTEHGSSLSACAYALVALEFGELDCAYNYFLKTANVDLQARYKLYAGTVFIGGSHPAANGGAWMTTIHGFAGLRLDAEGLSIQPRLYSKWKQLQFEFSYKGDRFGILITQNEVTLTAAGTNRRTHNVNLAGNTLCCEPGSKLLQVLHHETIYYDSI